MGRLVLFQREGLLELDGLLLQIGDRVEIMLLGAFVPGMIAHNEQGWYFLTRERMGIRLQTGLVARLLELSPQSLPLPVRLVSCRSNRYARSVGGSSLADEKDPLETGYYEAFGDELPGEDVVDEIFSRLDVFTPPEDLVNRVMQRVSCLPLPQMAQRGFKVSWGDDDLIVYHEHERPS
jgi:hypothetical protein